MKSLIAYSKGAILASAALAILVLFSAVQAPAVQGTGVLPAKEVKALLAKATTPAEHLKLARHFSAKADEHDAEAKEHETLAAEYKTNPQLGAAKHPMAPNTAEHCQYFVEHCRKAAQALRAMAAAHESMAKEAKK